MKKILFILAFVYTAFSYGQGGPKVDAVKYKGDVTTTVRNLIDVPVGETWLVWNTTLSQFEYAGSDDVWNKLIVDGAQTTELFQVATQALNKIEVGIDGPTGGTDYVRISGGETSGQAPLIYITDNRLAVSNYDNTDIDAVGATSLITKAYGDANYGSGGVTDGDKGDITVSSGGTSWQLDAQTVTSAEIAFKTITAQDIADATITSDQLADTNNPSSGDVLGWSGSGNTFTWVPNSGSSPPFDDTTSLVQDPVDNTKQLRFDVEDVNTGTTAVFSVAGTNLMNVTFGVRGGILNDTSYFYNYLSDKTTVASQFGYDGTLNMALIRNAISNDSIVLPDTGGIRMTDALTATSFIKDGATSDDVLLGDGTTTSLAGINTDDQTASEVAYTNNGQTTAGGALDYIYTNKEDIANKATNLDTPDNETYPTTQAVVDAIEANNLLTEIEITASRTALLTDANGLINVNSASAVTYTIPTNASVAFPIGTVISLVQESTGAITIAYSGGVTGGAASTYATGQRIALWKTASDTWQVLTVPEPKEVFVYEVALSDYTSDLTTGTSKAYWRAPFDMTITDVRASVLTAPVGSTIIVDVNDGGTSIMTTNKLSIDASEKTSTTAATAAGLTDTAIADDAEVTFDIDQIGSSTAGAGLLVKVYYTKD